MTPRRALVILAVECFAAHLLTWRAVSEAALLHLHLQTRWTRASVTSLGA